LRSVDQGYKMPNADWLDRALVRHRYDIADALCAEDNVTSTTAGPTPINPVASGHRCQIFDAPSGLIPAHLLKCFAEGAQDLMVPHTVS
jgi:hypothetical protein